MLALIVSGLGPRIGEALAIRVRDNIGCPHCKALRPRKCQRFACTAERLWNDIKTAEDKERQTRCGRS
jgi:hypothetical protein